jgi:hypothetical protein
MNSNYTTDSIRLFDIIDQKKVRIPKFQRGVVWNQTRKKDFIKSVKEGDPFGVILVYKDKKGEYLLIDGLQRLSTLVNYKKNPIDFLDEEDSFSSFETELLNIVQLIYTAQNKISNEDNVKDMAKMIKKGILETWKKDRTLKGLAMWSALEEKLKLPDNRNIIMKFDDYYEKIKADLDLPNIVIPSIVYDGPKSRLPNVFYNLNTGSVQLSKYEIHASTWGDKLYKINDEDLLNYVISKYDTIKEDSDFEVDYEPTDVKENGITLFEYCYSVSEMLYDQKNNLESLFGKKSKSTDPVGFELLSIILGLDVNQSEKIADEKYLGGASPEFLVDLSEAIRKTAIKVKDALKPLTLEITEKIIRNDRTYQIYHILYSYFINSYKLDLENYKITEIARKENQQNFIKYAPKIYFLDIISSLWEENRQVSDLTRLINDKQKQNSYFHDVDNIQIIERLVSWFEKIRQKSTGKTVANDTRLFFNYIYKMKLKENRNYYDFFFSKDNTTQKDTLKFDYEHIIPIQKFKSENLIKILPVSTIGNMCYMPVKENRSKKDVNLHVYTERFKSLSLNKDFLNFVYYPDSNEIPFTEYQKNEFIKHYEEFINKREKFLIEEFNKLILKHSW